MGIVISVAVVEEANALIRADIDTVVEITLRLSALCPVSDPELAPHRPPGTHSMGSMPGGRSSSVIGLASPCPSIKYVPDKTEE
jgi:hypothetical protein